MKNNIKRILKNISFFTFIVIAIISCENDFADVGSDIVGSDNFTTNNETFSITTYTQRVTPTQSNGLPNYLLGHFNDPIYGGSSASIVSQVAPMQFNPNFPGDNIILDSIILTIPYFSQSTGTDDDGNTLFDIDSIYGNSPIRLSVFQNNFFLRDFDPNGEFNQNQQFFSNGSTSENDLIPISLLEGTELFRNDSFVPDLNQLLLTEVDISTDDTTVTRSVPALRIKLENPNGDFWENLIFNREGEAELSNINNFNDHFRGIYIKAEPIVPGADGFMSLLDLATTNDSNITLFYTSQTILDDEVQSENQNTFTLNFSGNTVNIFNNDFIPIPDGDSENGDEQLFLKGGEGSMAVINLFNGDENGNSPEFEEFKTDFRDGDVIKRLVNEAFLEFHVDQNIVQGEEPNRIYIYDLNNNIPLIDYNRDISVGVSEITSHLRPLTRVDDGDPNPNGEGVLYRIRITEHINNLILRDSTNVKLGLVVTSNVDLPSTSNLFLQNENQLVETLPVGAMLSPRGTVLIGNNTTDDARRVQFRVFYTEPDN